MAWKYSSQEGSATRTWYHVLRYVVVRFWNPRAASIRSDQEHVGAIRSAKERPGACQGETERSIKEDPESAGPIGSDQGHVGALRSK